MTKARRTVVREGQEGTYHCIARCVRRAFLCGYDDFSGKDYEHRKEWIRLRLKELAGIFAVDVCDYAVMSNHLHVILRNRPDWVTSWSDEEVASRWRWLFPLRRDPTSGQAMEPNPNEIKALAHSPSKMLQLRERLQSISWVMRCLNEWVARKANREDECKGRFWEGRFTSVALLDNAAVLTCSAYIDLNPIRAGIADTPEESDYTSAQDRILARQAKHNLDQLPESAKTHPTYNQKQLIKEMEAQQKRADWLCPIRDTESRKGFLNMDLDDYLGLLDWTGRQIRQDKPGAIPAHFDAILDRLEIDQEAWLDTVQHFGSRFYRVAGSVKNLVQAAREAGQHWFQGKTAAQLAYKST
ncbi:MAG: hypothetical protein H6510_00390 [Acidobacteria bacterium]|nr:hypothetical protein [Acidobacteriota bacterium]MCB9396246.1 hypothetical protein [Acidobacteriota bacterium]